MARTRVSVRLVAGALGSAVTVVAALLATPLPASAAPELAPTMLILDASGSMKESAGAAGDKMTAAKQAVRTLVQQAPDDARLGLAVYGTGTGNAAADKAAGCNDVKVVHKVGKLDRAALSSTVDSVQASGYTPIGTALRVAARELPGEGPRAIVLVSDGEDSCAPPDPCQVAKELAAQGIDLRIHTIGFDVDGKARDQLACVALSTGGTYTDAADAGQLSGAINRAIRRALRAYEAAGRPVVGTPQPAGAPKLTPGAYLDTLAPDEVKYYAVEVPAGYTLYAGATMIDPTSRDVVVLYNTRYASTGEKCGYESTVRGVDEPVTPAVMRWTPPGDASAKDPCDRPGPMLIQVSLDGQGAKSPTRRPLELQIGLEPPLVGDAGPPASGDRVAFTAPTGPAKPVVGGGSFHGAATLDGSGSYTETVAQGEMTFYRVRLDWGQGFAYRITIAEDASAPSYQLFTRAYAPARAEVAYGSVAYSGKAEKLPAKEDALTSHQVRYANRTVRGTVANRNAYSQSWTSVAGWYYISVTSNRDGNRPPHEAKITLELSVTGAAGGRPAYSAAEVDTFGDKPPAAAPGGQDQGGSGSAARKPTGAQSRLFDGATLLWVGLALVLLLVGAALGVSLVIRRRRARVPAGAPHPWPGQDAGRQV